MMRTRVADLEARLAASQEAVEQARIALAEEQGQSPEMTTLQLDTLNQTLAERAAREGAAAGPRPSRRRGAQGWTRPLGRQRVPADDDHRRLPAAGDRAPPDELTALGAISAQRRGQPATDGPAGAPRAGAAQHHRGGPLRRRGARVRAELEGAGRGAARADGRRPRDHRDRADQGPAEDRPARARGARRTRRSTRASSPA